MNFNKENTTYLHFMKVLESFVEVSLEKSKGVEKLNTTW